MTPVATIAVIRCEINGKATVAANKTTTITIM